MIECIFTIDYEIYGSGEGSLRELVYEPTEKLRKIFRKHNARFVIFVEVAELEMMELCEADGELELVKKQVRDLYQEGHEIGFHIHPWWYNARHEDGRWILDYEGYNLCTYPKDQIGKILDRSLAYLRTLLGIANFTPVSYRAGHLLFQPSKAVAECLAERGIKVDSSVYKGGLWHKHGQDYRRALKNGYYWKFTDPVDVPKSDGALLEVPIYTNMIPIWKMFTSRRMALQKKGSSTAQVGLKAASRLFDYMRLFYPKKFDVCSMSSEELTHMLDSIIQDDQIYPSAYRPIVAIGHTKEMVDFGIVESLLFQLKKKGINTSTLVEVHQRITS
jgi:peptidoglycan/xylan/chitin deacetylase (PgdA/CDA1 family)